MNAEQALVRNVRTCRSDVKGDIQMVNTHKDLSTNAEHRGGPLRSSVEISVMETERRQWLVQFNLFDQPYVGGIE
ncbi:hypothetical protein A9Q81_12665 [Gammaproteobacteria bacterium 42_54_T18]|nr:hypothetical protein A9Q81_12665 [Gammaproteobacteria bacterium 42_54_T18]